MMRCISYGELDANAFCLAAGITNATQIYAINTLTYDLKINGLWTKMKAVYPFVGGTASSHKFNLKNPVNTDAAYRLTFGSAVTITHSANGVLPTIGGTNSFANTYITPSTALTLNSVHFSYYSRTDVNNGGIEMGCYGGTANADRIILLVRYNADILRFGSYNITVGEGLVATSNTNSTGFYIGSRTASDYAAVFKNGSNEAFITTSGGTPPAYPIYLFAINATGVLTQQTGRQCAFASIGDGLTDAEALIFYNIVQKYQTTLGRQV